MRLITYLPPDAPGAGTSFDLDRYGRAAGLVGRGDTEVAVDLAAFARRQGGELPARLLEVIAEGPATWERVRELLERAPAEADGPEVVDPTDVRILAPLPAPASLRDFYAFEQHVRTGFAKRGEQIPEPWFEFPVYYKGNHRSILGPGETIPWPSWTDELDYELELAMVVGRRGRDLTEQQATDAIFGYTLMNDVSARDLQRREMQVRLGPAKSKDFATVLGPILVTADELDPADLRVVARIDGEVVTDSHTGDMRWSFAEMLAHVSRDEDVFPGDVYGSGTVSGGCGLETGRLLTRGCTIELEAPGIGVLRNPVAA